NKPFKPVHTDFISFVANTKNKKTQKMLQSIITSSYSSTFLSKMPTTNFLQIAKTSITTGIYAISSTSLMDYASIRKNLLATFQQNQIKPLTISNIIIIVPLTTQPEIKLPTLT
ncbi:3006_t:CDS:2, partial [Scutellospora calospora]